MTWHRSDPYAGILFHCYSRAIHYGKGRVYTTMLGHLWKDCQDTAMRCVGFQTILIRGVEWATTGRVTYPVPKDSQPPARFGCESQPRSPRKAPRINHNQRTSRGGHLVCPVSWIEPGASRAFLGHVSRSPSVGLRPSRPVSTRLNLAGCSSAGSIGCLTRPARRTRIEWSAWE